MPHTIDAVSQVPELLGVVQHFNTLGVGIVADCEGPGDGGCKFPVGIETLMSHKLCTQPQLAVYIWRDTSNHHLTSLSLCRPQSSPQQSKRAGTLWLGISGGWSCRGRRAGVWACLSSSTERKQRNKKDAFNPIFLLYGFPQWESLFPSLSTGSAAWFRAFLLMWLGRVHILCWCNLWPR